ncbi:hypothetical protein AAG906_030805 [Vitis piasezkii]
MDIAQVAKEVHIASRSAKVGVLGNMSSYDNLKDGLMIFNDGGVYHFPFLDTNDIITMEDNCVGPLYKHTFPPTLVAWLSFVGLPLMGLGFILYEFQSKWIAGTPKWYTHGIGHSQKGPSGAISNDGWMTKLRVYTHAFHDEWEDEDFALKAHEDFAQCRSNGVDRTCIS